MIRRAVVFSGPRRVEIRDETIGAPGPGEVLVRTAVSGISAGTERLFYRGDVPEGVALDETLGGLRGRFRYPVSYGYAAVGEVVEAGPGVTSWLGRRVFAFAPHASHVVVRPETDGLQRVPDTVPAERAALLPMLETAVNLALDARPILGERALVIGQGVVGLAATAVLARFPLERLWSVEPREDRRRRSLRWGAGRSLSPDELAAEPTAPEDLFDLSLELSGSPEALGLAISRTGFEGRVVVGSWYGAKRAPLDLGTHFHRGRLRILSSQVSRLPAALTGRWTKARRLAFAWKLLEELPLEELVTHRVPIERAGEAYALLDGPGGALQVLLTYS